MPDIIERHQKEFDQITEEFAERLKSIRTGRATPALIENIVVPAYGVNTRLQELASISVADPKTMMVQPWDKNILKEIEKAITSSDLGLSVSAVETSVRVSLPPMTEETRMRLVKVVGEKAQEAFLGLRRVRDVVREEILEGQKEKEITEDDRYQLQDKLDKFTREYQERIQALKDKKVKEVTTV